MRSRTILLLALAAALSPPAMASAQELTNTSNACGDAVTPPSNWTCVGSNFNGTSITNDEYVWFNMHLSKVDGLPTTGGTVYFKDAFVTLAGTNEQIAIPDGSITFIPGYGTPSITYDGSGWHTTVSTSLTGSNVFMAGVGAQVPLGSEWKGQDVLWEGTFWYDPALTGPISMSWQWSAAAYECDKSGATAAQIAACDAALGGAFASLAVNVDSEPTAVNSPVNFVVGGARGGGAANVTGSWSGTANNILADPLPLTTVPEPATTLLLGTGLIGFGMAARRRRNHKKK